MTKLANLDYNPLFDAMVRDTAAAAAGTTPSLTPSGPNPSPWANISNSYATSGVFYDSSTKVKYFIRKPGEKDWPKSTSSTPVGPPKAIYQALDFLKWTSVYFNGFGINTLKPDKENARFGVSPGLRIKNVVDFLYVCGYLVSMEEKGTPDINHNYRFYIAEKGTKDYYAVDWLIFPKNFVKTSFTTYVLPKFEEYFNLFLERTDVQNIDGTTGKMPLPVKAKYEQWRAGAGPEFIKYFKQIAKGVYNTVGINSPTGYGGIDGSTATVAPFADIVIGGKNIQFLISFLANQTSFDLRPPSNEDGILENFGFADWLAEEAPDNWDFGEGDDGDRDAAGMEEAFAANNGFWEEIVTAGFGEVEATESELLSFRQCALMTEILQDENTSNLNNYWSSGDATNTNYWGSPLSVFYKSRTKPSMGFSLAGLQRNINSAHYRIYPIDPSYDSSMFINQANIGTDVLNKTFYSTKANDTDPGLMGKSLSWIYEGSDGKIRKKNLSLSSFAEGAVNRQKLRELNELLRIYETVEDNAQLQAIARLKSLDKPVPSQNALPQAIETQRALVTGTGAITEKEYFTLKNVNVKFEGTNISTARKDVQVELSWEVGDIGSLEAVLATMSPEDYPPEGVGNKVRLIDLVTLPLNNSPSVRNGANAWLSNQYSPNYSRLRLTLVPIGTGVKAQDNSAMIIDLTTIDHSISRDDDSGRVEFTINYRGFFETALEMPFNDVLASDETIASRKKRQEEAIDVLTKKNCDSRLVRKVMRMEQEVFAREARSSTYSTIIKRLEDLDLIHSYSLKEQDYKASITGNTFVASKNLVRNATKGGKTKITTSKAFGTLTAKIEEKRKKEENPNVADIIKNEELLDLKNRFIFLGDLMWVALDCLYQRDSAKMQTHVDNLNMRFVVAPITVPLITDLENTTNINPLSIPIDLGYFIRWFDENVTNKGVSFYPVGSFIRDLIDKLVNSLIFDICFNNLLPDETPCLLRGQIFSSSKSTWLKKYFFGGTEGHLTGKQVYVGNLDVHKYTFGGDALFPKSAGEDSGELTDTNYYVIYPLIPSFRRNQPRKKGLTLKDDPYTISLYTGIRNTNWNYLSNVSFSKVTAGNLREARYFNNSFGSLSLLSNVYDLTFVFYRRKANTYLYPGSVVNFYLLDFGDVETGPTTPPWGDGFDLKDSDPHKHLTTANILGFGGYFIVKSVEYKLGETDGEFEIHVSTKYLGNDAQKDATRYGVKDERLKIPKECADAFNLVASRANELNNGDEEVFTLDTRGSSDIPVTDINASNDANRVSAERVAEMEAPTTATVMTKDLLDKVVNAALDGYTKDDSKAGLTYKKASGTGTVKFDSTGVKVGKTTDAEFISAMTRIASTLQQDTRTFNSKISSTLYFADSSNTNFAYKVVINVAKDKACDITVTRYEPPDGGGTDF